MLTNLKALVVVLVLGLAVWVIARPICLRFVAADDYERRRNVWLALTVTAFVAPSFWLYAAVALPVLAWGAHKDRNPLAFYLVLLHVVSPFTVEIPVVGINQLFDMNHYRLLAFAVLLPVALKLMMTPGPRRAPRPALPGALLLAFGVLQIVLFMQEETFTHTLRRAFLFVLDVLLLYYVFSRGCRDRQALTDAMASFALACVLFAPVAVFETLKGWLLYQGIGFRWDAPILFAFLFRGDSLRAQASAGHSLPLGYMLAIGFGFWLYLRRSVDSRFWSWAVIGVLWLGLLAAYGRAPWLVAVLVLFAYLALSPQGVPRAMAMGIALGTAGALLLLSPWGDGIVANLPFVGTVDAQNVTYRQRLAEVSWRLIQQYPWFGTPNALDYMEELRQGQGIIDLVNTYAAVAVFHGLVGLALFVGVFASALLAAWRLARRVRRVDTELSLLGANLVACLVGTLFMLATGSFGSGLAYVSWILVALAVSYASLAAQQPVVLVRRGLRPAAALAR